MATQVVNTAGWFVTPMKLRELLVMTKMAPSKAAADRLIKQGAVTVKHSREEDPEEIKDGVVFVPLNTPFFLRVGRKWISPKLDAKVTFDQALVTELADVEELDENQQ